MMINQPNQFETDLEKNGDNVNDNPQVSEEQNTKSSNQQEENSFTTSASSVSAENMAQESVEISEPVVEVMPESYQPLEDEEAASQESKTLEPELQQLTPSESAEVIESLQQDISNLKSQLDAQIEENNSLKTQSVRIAADFDNFRRRTSKEKEELEQQIKKKTINEILTVVDNFERARTQIKPANDGEMNIHKSYQGVYKTLVDSLKRIGVSVMRPEGQPFDPTYHEAMLREPTNEYPEGTVIEQLVRGYLLKEEVLRHAMVKVAAPMENEAEQGAEAVDNQQSPLGE